MRDLLGTIIVAVLAVSGCENSGQSSPTESLTDRLKTHNALKVPHTSKFAPWRIETAVAFRDKEKALAFERCLKTHSGRAFAGKHL